MTGQEQLELIHELATERAANEGLSPFQRETDQTFSDVLCYLLGGGAISDEHLEWALSLVREQDARTVAARAERAS